MKSKYIDKSIVLKDVSFEIRNGVFVFKNLSISFGQEKTGLVGKNGVGKTTLLNLITNKLKPISGKIINKSVIGYLPQDYQFNLNKSIAETLGIAEKLKTIDKINKGSTDKELIKVVGQDWDIKNRAVEKLSKFNLGNVNFDTLLKDLSGGERMKVVLAGLLIWNADFLIMDEPTNNLDSSSRQAVYNLVKDWKDGLLIVSHDRELLNLMDRIIHLDEKGLKIYGGNYDFYLEQKKLETEALQRQLSDAKKEFKKTKKQAQEVKERQQKRLSHGKKRKDKLGLPKIITNEMKKSAQQTSGKLKIIHETRIDDALQNLVKAKEQISPENLIRVDLGDTEVPRGKLVVEIKNVSFTYLNSSRTIFENLNLTIYGPSRIAIDGPNGSGKTTLIKLVLGQLKPSVGSVYLGLENFVYLDQGVDLLNKSKTLLENLIDFSDLDEVSARNWLSRFLFYGADAFKKIDVLSGGERIKAALACVLAGKNPPQLLILDEPTNNLDLDSIEQIESALSNFKGTLIVVSHDKRFIQNIGVERSIEFS